MELSKRKYKKQEVQKLIEDLTNEFNLTINTQKADIKELNKTTVKQKLELEYYKEKEESILNAQKNAEQNLIDTNKKCDAYYELTVRVLENFVLRFSAYFENLKKKYPSNSTVKQAVEIKEELENLLSKDLPNKEIIKIVDEKIKKPATKKKTFNPKKKINDFIAATEDNGFNIDEVLNPGELKLEDLCKELGLTEDN